MEKFENKTNGHTDDLISPHMPVGTKSGNKGSACCKSKMTEIVRSPWPQHSLLPLPLLPLLSAAGVGDEHLYWQQITDILNTK